MWYSHFAWWPVKLASGEWRWLELVKRRQYRIGEYVYWTYKDI